MSRPDFWQDAKSAKTTSQKLENLKRTVLDWQSLQDEAEESLSFALEAKKEKETSLEKELIKAFNRLEKKFEKLEFLVLFFQKYDSHNAILAIHAGTGGVEAQDWAEMLLRMYLRFCGKKGFKSKIIDETRGAEAGIKSATFEVTGDYAFGNLKSEAGVHRLVRISPFDAQNLRHTSFALVEVMPELTSNEEIKLKDSELKIETMRAGGHGGQSVNTTDSAVRITHLPTGLVVKCQNERSQLQNKNLALKLLQAKLAELKRQAKGKEIAKIRGEVLAAAWGNQIRSYVLQPYKLVKDHRTDFESHDPEAVLDGELDDFSQSYLRYISKSSKSSESSKSN